MRSFLTAAVAAAAALAGSAQAATCSTATLATLLTNQYLSTCSSDSGYSFLTGVQPTPAQAALMCQSSACQSLLADVLALGLEECQLPIGNKINLFADLIDYVRNQCVTPTPTPTPTPEPTTEAPTPTPTSTPAVASCTAAQLRVILLSTYRAQCSTDASYSFTLPYVPTAEQVAAMCASSSCVSLFAEAQAAGLTECRTPTGGKILWLAELIDYVPSQCTTDAPTPAPTTEAPTPAPTTEAPTPEPTPAPTTEAPTPTPTSTPAVASCTAAQLRVILLSTYRAQCSTDASYSFTLPYVPTAEQVAAMCASSSCVSLFAEAQAAGLTECRTPTGGKILWLAELIDYVPSQCTTDAPTPAPTTEAPTPSPTTESPTPAPTTEAPTPSPTDSPNPTTSTPTSGPTATPTPEPTETPEPTTPPHDSC